MFINNYVTVFVVSGVTECGRLTPSSCVSACSCVSDCTITHAYRIWVYLFGPLE